MKLKRHNADIPRIDSHTGQGEESKSSYLLFTGSRNNFRHFAGALALLGAAFCLLLSGFRIALPAQAYSRQTREAGAATFHEKGCEHCHGVDGTGTDRGPDLSGIGKRWKKDRIEQQIVHGGGGMPPFGEALQPDEVRDLVDYLGAKRKAARAPKTPLPEKTPAKASSDDSGL